MADSELELLLSVIRQTAEITTGAEATVIRLEPSHLLTARDPLELSSPGTLGAALVEFCTAPDAPGDDPGAELRSRHFRRMDTDHMGAPYIFLSLPVAGHEDFSDGSIGFAFRAEDWRPDRSLESCLWLARCAETMLSAFENMAGLEFDVLTLSNRAARLQRIAEIDPLTQLENPASFEDKARTLIEGQPQFAAFVMIDIDHFKTVNDLYGHRFGDVYLKTISKAIKTAFPEGSVVGRLGGDEFGIMTPLPPTGRAYLDALLSRCKSSVQRSAAMLGKPDLGRVSIGASQYPEHARDYETLHELADAALYAAKDSGRSVSAVFHPTHHERYNNTELGKQFLAAVRDNQIVPYFQPIVGLRDGRCLGFEVLARWQGKEGRLLAPAEFATIFRDHTLAEKMTRTIMRGAFADYARAVRPRGRPVRLALNVTHFDLMNPEFTFEVQSAVADARFDWSLLTIEVTEQTMLGETNGQVFRSLNELRTRGARIALDDFGTGYGGLRHLAAWPVDTLKIDKYFVDGLRGGRRDRAILEAMVTMSRQLGYDVIAEGIETADQVADLIALGCDGGQGYLLAHPLAGEDLADYRDTYDVPLPA